MHPHYIWLPLLLLVVLAIYLVARRRPSRGGSGMGNRPDSTEPPELRGPEQHDRRA